MAANDIEAGRQAVAPKLKQVDGQQMRTIGRVVAAVAPLVSGTQLVRPTVSEITSLIAGGKP